MKMFAVWIVPLVLFLPCNVLSFTPLARLSLWPYHSNISDELGDRIKEFAEEKSTVEHSKLFLNLTLYSKRSFGAAKFNKQDNRTGKIYHLKLP